MSTAQIILLGVGMVIARLGAALPGAGDPRHQDFWVDKGLLVIGSTAIAVGFLS